MFLVLKGKKKIPSRGFQKCLKMQCELLSEGAVTPSSLNHKGLIGLTALILMWELAGYVSNIFFFLLLMQSWAAGDIVSCLIDLEEGTIAFCL